MVHVVIYEDTRQQAGKHDIKHQWFERHGIEIVRKKLDFGDYARDGSNIAIDTKKGLAEISGNVGREHDRFVQEINRAKDAGYRIVFMIEQGGTIKSVSDVDKWTNTTCTRCRSFWNTTCDSVHDKCMRYRHRPMTGATLRKILESMEVTHGCVFEIVHPRQSAQSICEWLGVDYERGAV